MICDRAQCGAPALPGSPYCSTACWKLDLKATQACREPDVHPWWLRDDDHGAERAAHADNWDWEG